MSSITFKPIIIKSGMRKDNTIPVYIRVYFKGSCRRIPSNLVCNYPSDITRSFKIKNASIINKAEELVRYMRDIVSNLNVFALDNMTVDDVVSYIKTHGKEDAKKSFGYKNNEIADTPLINSLESITEGMTPCYVYLMNDKNSNLYKIGISSNPKFREKTLQGQIPEIIMVCAKQYPKRKIALIIERILHETYEVFHTRGEWYRLPQTAIEEIKVILG